MLRVIRSDASVGVVGIKQLFPYTNTLYHTGIVFGPDGVPMHLYPHLAASLPQVNKEREYQAVTGACLVIPRLLFEECGGFDEAYVNGYEDVDLCLTVRQRGRRVMCCTSASIFHYGQISEGRTADDDRNAARFAAKWSGRIKADRDEYLSRDGPIDHHGSRPAAAFRKLANDCIYLADDFEQASSFTWINAELALALHEQGAAVHVNGRAPFSPTLPASTQQRLNRLALTERPVGGVQIKWSHYWDRHLNLELTGDVNLELFVTNYLFGTPASEPWDFWLQSVRDNGHEMIPLSEFCKSVLLQVGVPENRCHVWSPGYAPEIESVEAPDRRNHRFRFLTITNSNDLGRYNTLAVMNAYRQAFGPGDDTELVVKDYGASSADIAVREYLARHRQGARIEYLAEFTGKRELIQLHKASDAFVSAHRGEGFGVKILDALACGLPVITPLFGGPTDFCTRDNCFPVGFSLVPMGDCLDSRSLRITNRPLWAEVDLDSLAAQMRKVYDERESTASVAARARSSVQGRFTWSQAALRMLAIVNELRDSRAKAPVRRARAVSVPVERSPYWLGLRVSVIVPTHNRKEKLLTCLDALSRQSILPQEFEVIVIDDGSTDGTAQAVESLRLPFGMRYYRQECAGPASARNLGIEKAAGELVLFVGDDIYADERLLEEHLLAHAANPEPGVAILGRIDWPDDPKPNALMEYVCGDAAHQFAYGLISRLPVLDHRFFYTSNISLKRQFLDDAAESGVGFNPRFRHAAFEDSEFAFRLAPRGLRILYAERARARHDHWMDLDSFARRQFRAGEMAVVFYRMHPGQDNQLQVRWIADLVEASAALLNEPDLFCPLEAFDRHTDDTLRSMAATAEALVAASQQRLQLASAGLPEDRLRATLGSVLSVIFDVHVARGKVQEWFSMVGDPAAAAAAQSLASVQRKMEFFDRRDADASDQYQQQLEHANLERDRLHRELDRLHPELDRLHREHDRILESRSWRLTAPLRRGRAAVDAIRRALRRKPVP